MMKKTSLDALVLPNVASPVSPLPMLKSKVKVRNPLDEEKEKELEDQKEIAQDVDQPQQASVSVQLVQAETTGAALADSSASTVQVSAPADTEQDSQPIFGWLAMGALAAVASASTGSTPVAPVVAVAINNVVTGTIVAGPVIDGNGLKVEIYAANGTSKLGESTVDATGRFTVNIGTYTGIVIARVVDTTDGNDYLDEATGVSKDLNATLMATTVVPGGTVTLNINPLTAIAAQKAGLAADGSGSLSDTAAVINANAAVAAAFGLTDLTGTTVHATNGDSYNSDDGLSESEKYGAILAALSGADLKIGGNSQATINALVANLTTSGSTGSLNAQAMDLVIAGAQAADASGSALTAVGSTLTGNTVNDTVSAVAKIASYADSNTNSTPGVADYAAAGVTGVTAANLAQVNARVDGVVRTAADTTPEIQLLVAPANAADLAVSGAGLGNATNDTTPTLTGTAEAGSTVKIYSTDGTTLLGTATADASTGAWSITSSTLTSGAHTLTVNVTDAAGNTNASAGSIALNIDTTAPAAPSFDSVADDNVINGAEIYSIVAGTNEVDAQVVVKVGGRNRIADVDGTTWRYTLTDADITAMGQGIQELKATQTDAAGNTSEAGTHTITVDTAAPSVVITSSASTLKIGQTATITFTFSHDPGNSFTAADIVVTGGTLATLSGSGVTRTALFTPNNASAAGSASISVASESYTNASGSTGSAGSTPTISIDTVAPTPLSYLPVDGTNVLPSGNLVLTFSEAIAKGTGNIRLVNDSDNTLSTTIAMTDEQITVSGNTLTINPTNDLIGGNAYHLEFDATAITDTAGNAWAGISNATDWNFIATSPAISLNAIATDNRVNALENGATITVSGTVSSNESTALAAFVTTDFTITLTPQGGGAVIPVTVTAFDGVTGIWSGSIAANALADAKTYDVAVTLLGHNGAANTLTTSTSGRISIDLTPPAAPVIDAVATDDIINAREQSSLITGTNEAGATSVVLSVGGNNRATTVDGTTWSYALTAADITALGQGAEILSATQTDAAGNISAAGTRDITVDTKAPSWPTFNRIASDNVINASEVHSAITGNNEAGAAVTLLIGGNTRSADVTGTTWSYTLTDADITAMGQGTKALKATSTDAAGNISMSMTQMIQVDTAAPSVAITSSASTLKIGQTATITFTFSHDPGNSFTAADIVVTGGTLSEISTASVLVDSHFTRTAIFTPANSLSSGSASITVIGGSYTNTYGSPGTAGTTPTIYIDTVAPTPLSFYPVDDTTLLPSGNLLLNFTETIAKGTGAIRLVNDSTQTTTTIDVNDSQVSVSGNTLTINPTADLTAGDNYHIEIDSGALTDVVGNAWMGVFSETDWNFTAATPTIKLNAIATDNIVNGTESLAVIAVSGVVSSNDTAVLAAFVVGDFTVALYPIVTAGAAVPVTVISYDGDTGIWAGTVSAGALTDGERYTVAALLIGHNGVAAGLTTETFAMVAADFSAAAPVISMVAGDDIINGSETTSFLSGTAENNANLTLSFGSTTRSFTASALGEWRYALTADDISAMSEGAETLSLIQVDAAGNTSSAGTRNITVNTAALTAPTIHVVAGDNIINLSESNGPVVITGTNAAGATVALDINGHTAQAVVTGTTWSYTLESALSAAIQNADLCSIVATQTDVQGNTSAPAVREVIVDVGAPQPITMTPSQGSNVLPDGNLTITFGENIAKGSGNIRLIDDTTATTIIIAISSDEVTFSNNTLTINPNADLIGGHAYRLEMDAEAITDLAGNAQQAISAWRFTASSPAISLNAISENGDGLINNEEFSAGIYFNGTVKANDGSVLSALVASDITLTVTPRDNVNARTLTIFSDNYDAVTGYWEVQLAGDELKDGTTYDVSVTLLGHNGAATNLTSSTTSSFTIDRSAAAPTIDIVSTDNVLSSNNVGTLITGMAEANAQLGLRFGTEGKARYFTADNTGAWRYSITAADLADFVGDGPNKLYAVQKDVAGNLSRLTTRDIYVETNAPTASFFLAIPTIQLNALENATSNNFNTMPQVAAVGTNGDYVVTWSGRDPGDFSVFVQKFHSDGTYAGAAVKLESNTTTAGQDYYPVVTQVGGAGEFVVAWFGDDTNNVDAGDQSIYVQKFTAEGEVADNKVVVLSAIGNTTGTNQVPQIAALSDGAYLVTWYGQNTSSTENVYVQKFNADGTVGANPTLAFGNFFTADNRSQITAVGADGDYVVTWSGFEGNTGRDYSIKVQKISAEGELGTLVTLEPQNYTTGNDTTPQVAALDSTGAYVVTWTGPIDDLNDSGNRSIFVQQFNADGSITGLAQVQLNSYPGNSTQSSFNSAADPQVTSVGNEGKYVVMWSGLNAAPDGPIMQTSIFVQQFNADGTTASTAPIEIKANDVKLSWSEKPQVISLGSSGAFVVAWSGTDTGGDRSIFVQQFNTDGSTTGHTQVLLEAPNNTGSPDTMPQLTAIGSTGEYVVTWKGISSTYGQSIFVQKFNADGTTNFDSVISPENSVKVQSSELGTAYLVNDAVPVSNLASITGAADNQWNQVAITAINTPTLIAATGLTDGVYHVYAVDFASNISLASTNTIRIDSTAPRVTSVALSGGTDDQFNPLNAGDVTGAYVVFDEVVFVTGTPQVALTIGSTKVLASYASGSGSKELYFSYAIQAGENDSDGLSIEANSMTLNGGTIADALGNSSDAADLAHALVAANPLIRVDTIAPVALVTPASLTDTSTAVVQSSEVGTAYLVADSLIGSSVYTISNSANYLWNSVAITAADTNTNLSLAGLTGGAYRLYSVDAAGNLSAASTGAITVLPTVPTVTLVAITGATGITNDTLNAGDVVSVTVTMSEATTVTGTPQLNLDVDGTIVQANYVSGSGGTALVFEYIILANQSDLTGISIVENSLSLNSGTMLDADNNAAVLSHALAADNASFKVDTTAPSANVTAASIANNGNAVVQSTEVGTAYLVRNTASVNSLADITGLADAQYNSVTIDAANTATNLSVAGLEAGVYKVYTIDAAGNMSAVSGNTVLVTNTANATQINLNDGGLIAPVYVDGQWFAYWDRSGDGASTTADLVQHHDLDAIFRFGSDFATVNGSNDTTGTYRYSTLNGVKLALPTHGDGTTATSNRPGTAIDNSPAGETNDTYNDLLAIWDAHNGSGTTASVFLGATIAGVPAGWASSTTYAYWAASQVTANNNFHLAIMLGNGNVSSYGDSNTGYVALQVL